MLIEFWVNEKVQALDLPPDMRLIDVLRNILLLTGTKECCGEGECGACTVLVDGRATHSCLTLACQLNGKHVTTIEGLTKNGQPDKLQKAFVEAGAIQCGYCTSGMILTAKSLLQENPNPSEEEIKVALAGNICRCSGYSQIIGAIKSVSEE